jgi:hypothetical protein
LSALSRTVSRVNAQGAAVPRVLTDPPWLRETEKGRPADEAEPVVTALEPPAARTIVWAPGERETWAAARPYGAWKESEWEQAVHNYLTGEITYEATQAALFAQAPAELVRPLLAAWRPDVTWDFAHSLKPIVARFEMDARDAALHVARRNAHGIGEVLLPFLDAEVARLMADWLYRLKSAQHLTREWFGRHGVATVPFLVPDALGRSRVARRNAWAGLWLVASARDATEIVEAARTHGDAAADAVAGVLAGGPPADASAGPSARPAPPKVRWADPATLPRPRLRGGDVLPVAATGHLITLLALPGRPGLKEVLDACTPESLAEFGWALFEAWRSAGRPPRDSWVLSQLGVLGDDETVRRLTPVIRDGQSGPAKAVLELGVLSGIGTDVALIHLNAIAQKARYRGLRAAAERTVQEVARARGLTAEQLADRLVPDLGLDDDGGLVLDYGPRRFAVGFDERLKPYAVDDDGRRRKDLPKPGAKDDPRLAPAAKKRFATLKKDVRTVAGDQIQRLESAMVAGRRWTPAEFAGFFVGHPLMRHIAGRLVWVREDGVRTAFHIAADRAPTGLGGERVALPGRAAIGIAHPLHLGETLTAWSELLAERSIGQPFPQLGRPVHSLTEPERTSGRLTRFEGITVPVGAVLALTRRGWDRGAPQDDGTERWVSRPVPGGYVVINLDPGIQVGYLEMSPEQRLEQVWLGRRPGHAWLGHDTSRRFGELDPVTASEILADLALLTRSAVP